MPYEPIVPEGQHLGNSRDVDDAKVGHLFDDDTNNLVGHAAWKWVDEPDDDYQPVYYRAEPPRQITQEDIQAALALAALIAQGVAVAVPHVRRWMRESVVPAVQAGWQRITKSSTKVVDPAAEAEPVMLTATRIVEDRPGTDLAVPVPKIRMNSAEWEQRYLAMLAAKAFHEEQLRLLLHADIEGAGPAIEAQTTMNELSPRQFSERMKQIRKARPDLLSKDDSAEIVRVFREVKNDDDASASSS
ncbi:hypothetical protein [Microbacterium sp. A84]|uniref:hypothetical protein n=1 Tax=Microbacterium sp. A84 TaxID=3450715 RepID=UPI003F428652